MKNLIKNDDAISVVVGAILILAVLVTFMSVVTSSWVPIYEGNAESDHSDTTHRTFMDLHKQIEYADEFTNYATIDLGTDDMSFIKNSYSVGYLEVNESSGGLFLKTDLTRTDYPESSVSEFGLNLIGINLSSDTPLSKFEFELLQLAGPKPLHEDFMVQMVTTNNRWITLYNSVAAGNKLTFVIKYGDPTVRWKKEVGVTIPPTPYVDNDILHVDMLDSTLNLTLVDGTNQI